MKNTILFLIIHLWTVYPCKCQDSTISLLDDAAVYRYSMEKFIDTFHISGSLWLEGTDFYSGIPKIINGVTIKTIYSFDYRAFFKKYKKPTIIHLLPITTSGKLFEVNVIVFKCSFNKKKSQYLFINSGGLSIKFQYECGTGTFHPVSFTLGH